MVLWSCPVLLNSLVDLLGSGDCEEEEEDKEEEDKDKFNFGHFSERYGE